MAKKLEHIFKLNVIVNFTKQNKVTLVKFVYVNIKQMFKDF